MNNAQTVGSFGCAECNASYGRSVRDLFVCKKPAAFCGSRRCTSPVLPPGSSPSGCASAGSVLCGASSARHEEADGHKCCHGSASHRPRPLSQPGHPVVAGDLDLLPAALDVHGGAEQVA